MNTIKDGEFFIFCTDRHSFSRTIGKRDDTQDNHWVFVSYSDNLGSGQRFGSTYAGKVIKLCKK